MFGVTPKKEAELRARMLACGLDDADLEEQFLRARGAGGQHVNKTATAVYLKHRPSGLEVKMQKARSQALNRFYARRRLCELLEEQILGKQSPVSLQQEKLRKQKARRHKRAKQKKPAEPVKRR
jgi:peptide chain release factor